MIGQLLHLIAGPLARLWVTESAQSWRTLPVPTDAPVAHAPGLHPDRILLVGSGAAVSYGVMSYNLGLAGHLARTVSAMTDRGASVFVRADPDMTVPEATAALAKINTAQFDAVVAVLGGLEAVTFFPVRQWRKQIDAFIAASPVPVFIVGLAPIASIIRMPRTFGAVATAHGRRINAQTEAACAEDSNATFVPFSPTPGDIVSLANRDTYAEWAGLIAPPVACTLNSRVESGVERPPIDEAARQRALDEMAITQSTSDEELQRIVETVRDLFGTSAARLNVIDHSHQVVLAAVGVSRDQVPRESALCNDTIQQGDVLVIDDKAARTNDTWSRNLAPYKFYAGYPIESPDGHRIGALCILDVNPRAFDNSDRALLRDLAVHTQQVLWERALRS